jgi:hypothetical protein
MSDVGHGIPDLFVSLASGSVAIGLEVKDGTLPPSARRLTEAEERWKTLVPDRTFTVHSLEEALKVCKEFFG